MIGLLMVVGLAVWAVDRWSIVPLFPLEPAEVVPIDASVVVRLPRMGQVLSLSERTDRNAWQEAMVQLPGWREDITQLNQLLDTLIPARTVIERSRGLLSLHTVAGGQLGGTWIIDLRNLGKLDIASWLESLAMPYRTSSFRGQTIWTVRPNGKSEMAIGHIRNLLIVARQVFQVEAVLAAGRDTDNWVEQLGEVSEQALCSVYLNADHWEDLSNLLLSPAGKKWADAWRRWTNTLRLDIFPDDDGYRLEGITEHAGRWLDTRLEPAPPAGDLWGLLPEQTAALKSVTLSDHLAYYRRLSGGEVGRFQRFFLPWMVGPALEITLRPFNGDLDNRRIYLLPFADQEVVRAALDRWMAEVGVLQTVDYQGFRLTQVYEDERLFIQSDRKWSNPWWTSIGNFVVLATDRPALDSWIDHYVVGSTLPLSEAVRRVAPAASGPQFAFFLDWQQWRTAWPHLFTHRPLAGSLAELGQLSLTVESNGAEGVLRGNWQAAPGVETASLLAWRRVLDSEVIAGPWLIRDQDGTLSIAVQDADHRLYLFDEGGKPQWTRLLDRRIISRVQPLALDGRTALTFNTRNAVYLLEMDGEHRSPFPLQLRNATSVAQTVIDFSANQDYTFFVVSDDGCVYGYDLQGGGVPAWNPRCQLGVMPQPLLHFQEDNRDYLVIRNTSGSVQAFARDGSLRLQGDFSSGPSQTSLQVQLEVRPQQIVSCSDSGLVEILPLDAAPMQFSLPVGNNTGVSLVYADFAGDARRDFLLSSESTVALHTYTGRGLEKQFERRFPQTVSAIFAVTAGGENQAGIGLLLRGSDQIYLLDTRGEAMPGFPLAGSTPFFIAGLFGEPHLVVGYRDELMTYRMADLQGSGQ